MARPRDADLLREAEELQRMLIAMAGTHPAAAQRLAIDFQDSQLEYRAGRLLVGDYCAELTEIRRRLAQHFASQVSDASGDVIVPLPPKGDSVTARFVRDPLAAPKAARKPAASAPVRKPSLYT